MVRQTERGENLDADLVERARTIVAMMKGREAPGVIPFRCLIRGKLPLNREVAIVLI